MRAATNGGITSRMNVEVALGSTLAGFRVERLLGRGAMGAVYLAEDVHLRRKVALKVLAPELADDDRFRRRFLRESQLAASLEHPHIVPIYDAGEEDGVLFLAMKYVEGYDLRDAARRDRAASATSGRSRLLGQVADALDAAHGLGPRPPRRQAGEHPDRRRGGRARVPLRLRAREARLDGREPDAASALRRARSRTSRPSRSRAARSTRARTSTRSAACSTSA